LLSAFLKYTGEYLSTYPQIRLTTTEEFAIRDSVLKFLGLSNLNELRDRYEGQAFWDKTLKQYGALITCQKYLSLPRSEIDKLNLKDLTSQIQRKNAIYDVKVFDFGTLPELEFDTIQNPIIFVIQKDKSTFSICGFGEKHIILENLINSSSETATSINLKHFIGFNKLKPIREIQ
jgi:hypothetical protein